MRLCGRGKSQTSFVVIKFPCPDAHPCSLLPIYGPPYCYERGLETSLLSQWSMESDTGNPGPHLSPSQAIPPICIGQITSLYERPPFGQLQLVRTTSIPTDWGDNVKNHHMMKCLIFLQEYKWGNIQCWPPSKAELTAIERLLLCLLVIPLEFLQLKQFKHNSLTSN